ncbi:meso-butanediol dehydrogenase / (S,S)-butanediol dehydrogenase / diacetyl reductase/dihydroanticapsin dehydrogenase [Natronoarchaeum philippinense]|uniref:Meso-butanediol dehydrogenase / (S,S)-butanediol dehydrogenase / diacetyl reductase/dihydroanticapsin dehydrogenase n=1 Tax=Natronoarchaeum philippinense TaxID=558529 RepID=A0A285NSE9_NATPI|nr:SDR family NAD(P)-dependent oxidoreductase [Natronoarchaeum philippinense]SNZ12444.1 meso-butanediol dehydrogenase / (S,S)-butanediol dehydrogenase / diacetyl reductase/dihydroanticapsin dehydrogenase [Natronoarchaeum philippinense]
MSLQDRTAIVTGASSGIGRGVADRLAEAGANVVVADVRREPKQIEHYEREDDRPTDEMLPDEHGVEARYVETDVSDEDAVAALVEATVETFGGLDVLVNNAGIQVLESTAEMTREQWQRVIDVNLTGTFLLSKHAIPHLTASDQGRIVNVSSVNAYIGGAGAPYSASKAGIVNLTRDLALELAEDEVTVNTVLPGVIQTPMQNQNDEATRERQAEKTPLPRVGEPRDVANAVRFFASEDAEWITGAELLVDGGYSIGGY